MRQRHNDLSSGRIAKLLGAALIAGLSGACSSDILRFSDTPFANPFNGRADASTTGSINAPMTKVKASSLGMPQAEPYQPFPSAVGASPTSQAAMTQVAAAGAQPVTGSVAGWTAAGGTPVTVGSGDTIEALSGRYGVPVAALRQINGIKGQPSSGQQVIIPAYNPGAAGRTAASTVTSRAPAPVSAPAAPQTPRTPRYETLEKPVSSAPVAAPRAPRYESLSAAPAKVRPGATSAQTAEVKTPAKPLATAPAAGKSAGFKPVEKPKTVAKADPKAAVKGAKPVAQDDDDEDEVPAPAKAAPVKAAKVEQPKPVTVAKAPIRAEPETTASLGNESQEFRWPARGRVISGFGSKGPNGTNDGINIAVPEGTPVKAAEGGTVAYAGEEIKGYGKMVLIRHPNGYVSAYAHNGDLNVKRGDAVKRGQVIAKAGQTGNVTSPQLHFELRKGSEPIDPSKYLEGN
jgi:murein DD-endopeptidase MepM/ murein hydrolase activator NlpD